MCSSRLECLEPGGELPATGGQQGFAHPCDIVTHLPGAARRTEAGEAGTDPTSPLAEERSTL